MGKPQLSASPPLLSSQPSAQGNQLSSPPQSNGHLSDSVSTTSSMAAELQSYYASSSRSPSPDLQTDPLLSSLAHEDAPSEWDRASLPEDTSYPHFLSKMATSLQLATTAQPDPREQRLQVLKYLHIPKEVVSLPLHDILADSQKAIWNTPYSSRVTKRSLEHKYKVQEVAGFGKTQLPHQSLVVCSALRKSKSSKDFASTPPVRDMRIMDSMGKRSYQNSMLSGKIAVHQFFYTQYLYSNMEDMRKVVDTLPVPTQEAFNAILSNFEECSKNMIRAADDAFDTAMRGAATGICTRRLAWLQCSKLGVDIHAKVADAPCLGDSLFGDKVKDLIEGLKEDCTTMDALEEDTEHHSKQPFKQQQPSQRNFNPRKSFSSARQYASSPPKQFRPYKQQSSARAPRDRRSQKPSQPAGQKPQQSF
uniref:Uncharacterized protein LOC117365975 isoform X2 n=1 Tax=Geotrypetes seraphini TaxID=260995 RepID=A0A6P8S529_GEOSA|nr:uncharacterized protein LOC117365975 isoform X2 [Geotrypetes seraphini]